MSRLRLGLLAGEPSGDNLGAGLMHAVRRQVPDVEFVGVGGQGMRAAGLEPLADMDTLSVNGFREPLLRLPQLWRLYRGLVRDLRGARLDAFVGIDFNVFNFLLEGALRKSGLATAHYVSPSVYAWRAGRTRRVARSADLLLCLYPFEPDFYRDTRVQAEYVGHPLADEIDPESGNATARAAARTALGLDQDQDQVVLAVLPGSRMSEVRLMIADFVAAADMFCANLPRASVVIPCLRPELRAEIEPALARHPELRVHLYDGNARQALVAADLALIKSGTSTLEAMLLHRPMVVSYRLGAVSYQLARRLLRSPYIALPNILSGRMLVPELLQHQATAPALADALSAEWQRMQSDPDFAGPFRALHARLRRQADVQAATAVIGLARKGSRHSIE